MKSRNRIRIAAIMVVFLSGISFWILHRNQSGTIRKELYDFAVADTGSITRIYMVNTSGRQVMLDKKGPGNWMVNGKFKARNDAARNLLACMKDMQVRQPVARSAVETVSKQLATTATKVEIYAGEKLVKSYYVGSDTQDGLGTFMLLTDPETGENSTLPFVMFIPGFNGFLSVRYFLEEDLWRDRTVFAFYPDQISSIAVEYPRMKDSSFTISLNENNDISIADSKGNKFSFFDTLKAKRYITYYTNIQYEVLANDLRPTFRDSVTRKGMVHIIRLTDRAGKVHTVKTFSKPSEPNKLNPATGLPYEEDPEKMYALINEDKDMAVIQYYVFGKLLMGAGYFKTPSSLDQAIGVKK